MTEKAIKYTFHKLILQFNSFVTLFLKTFKYSMKQKKENKVILLGKLGTFYTPRLYQYIIVIPY